MSQQEYASYRDRVSISEKFDPKNVSCCGNNLFCRNIITAKVYIYPSQLPERILVAALEDAGIINRESTNDVSSRAEVSLKKRADGLPEATDIRETSANERSPMSQTRDTKQVPRALVISLRYVRNHEIISPRVALAVPGVDNDILQLEIK